MRMLRCLIASYFLVMLALAGVPVAALAADESTLFTTSVSPDALIVLDLSGSMDWNPAGGTNIWGDALCSGPTFYSSSGAGHNTDCSRMSIAKRAIFSLLDDNNDSTINSINIPVDDDSLDVRIGYMRFYNCSGDDTGGNYSAGCNTLIRPIGTSYSTIFCGHNSACTSQTGACSAGNCVRGENANGGTPLASSLAEAKTYLDEHKAADTQARDCRKKFVVLITDGADTYACSGNGTETQANMYQRRRAFVARAKALGDAGYKVFIIGFGSTMPDYLKNTLNWAAYYGQTDNLLDTNAGNTANYSIGAGALYPTGITACMNSATAGTCNGTSTNCFATANDPGNLALSGYAFIAANADDLATSLKTAFGVITSGRYSFSTASIASARTDAENFIYGASFEPKSDPFWIGRLKKFNINADGSVGTEAWAKDAGEQLKDALYNTRTMKTCTGTSCASLVNFTTSIDPRYFGFASNSAGDQALRNNVVNFIQGNPAANIEDGYKLGDIWHSSPVVITSPASTFFDIVDAAATTAFEGYRTSHERTSANGLSAILVGANDGQFHVFRASTGAELFSFIPPNLLPKLKLISHGSHPTGLQHQFFVDGPISASDVWLGSGSGTAKNASDWHALAVVGLGRGVAPNFTWSSSPNCTGFDGTTTHTFSQTYTVSTPYYCGYYAFDVTTPTSPQLLLNGTNPWRITPSAVQAPYLGDPWSKMSFGRVKINGNEKWVGFIGGGGYEYSCASAPTEPPNRGKGLFVVDLLNGNVLWSYTQATNASMAYSIPATPSLIDIDNDGFIDTAYVGDLGGNMWRFRFCTAQSGNSCGTGSWAGSLAYQQSAGQRRPVYNTASAARDASGNLWLYWGTGDRQCPAVTTATDRFYALKDSAQVCTSSGDCAGGGTCQVTRCSYTYGAGNLQDVTAFDGTSRGFTITMPGVGEKILGDAVVFGGNVYFLSYVPQAAGADLCVAAGGTTNLWGVQYTTGAGSFVGGVRSVSLGAGFGTGLQVSTSASGDHRFYLTGTGPTRPNPHTPDVKPTSKSSPARSIYWRDRRVQ